MRRVALAQPDLNAAILKAFQALRDSFTDAQLARLIESGAVDRAVNAILSDEQIARATTALQAEIQTTLQTNTLSAIRALPLPGAQVAVGFNVLSPNVLMALRALNTKYLQSMAADVRATFIEAIDQGLRDRKSISAIARTLRSTLGLGPSQLQQVQNFRAALEGESGRNPMTYALRPRNYDRIIQRGESLTPVQVDRATAMYLKRRIAQNAEILSRQAAIDSYKVANQLAWQAAADKGLVDLDALEGQWVGVMDDRERDWHVAMQGVKRKFTEPYIVPTQGPENYPGEGEFGCRCVERIRVKATA